MSGPRYDEASPGVSGAISDAVAAVKKKINAPERESESLVNSRIDDDGSTTPSNAGKQAQSSDRWNSY